jgi:hypothetical protein
MLRSRSPPSPSCAATVTDLTAHSASWNRVLGRSQINLIRASRFDTQVPAATSVWNTCAPKRMYRMGISMHVSMPPLQDTACWRPALWVHVWAPPPI